MADKTARLIIDSSENNADLLWATGFFVPDPCTFIQKRGRKYLIVSDLEYARAQKEARVDKVISYKEIAPDFKKLRIKKPSFISYADVFLRNHNVDSILVPSNFPLSYADLLRRKRYKVTTLKDPFFPERAIKSKEQITAISKAVRATERAIYMAIDSLKKSKIKRGRLYYSGRALTSERLRQIINISLLEQGYVGKNTIVAGGRQSADPHCKGHGPLRAHEPIVMDVYPRSEKTGYHADLTRTVCKGRAPEKLREMYRAVKTAQETAMKNVKHNAYAPKIHKAIIKTLEDLEFKTERKKGIPQGFIHTTGHGIGLEIHEYPPLGPLKNRLKAGNVITLEPGLYYKEIGGVRIEDDVLVTKRGCEVLSKLSKRLEI